MTQLVKQNTDLVKPRLYCLSENNSGGSFWLVQEDYESLLGAGWFLDQEEIKKAKSFLDDSFGQGKDGVPYSWRHGALKLQAESLREAVESFESATGRDFWAQGCNCCGAPFTISCNDPHEYISGDSVERAAILPW